MHAARSVCRRVLQLCVLLLHHTIPSDGGRPARRRYDRFTGGISSTSISNTGCRECEGAGADSPSFRLPVFERKPLFILLSNESLARPRGRGRGTREENGRGRGGGHGRRVLDHKTEVGRGEGRAAATRGGAARGSACDRTHCGSPFVAHLQQVASQLHLPLLNDYNQVFSTST